jgi:hypothetical protein
MDDDDDDDDVPWMLLHTLGHPPLALSLTGIPTPRALAAHVASGVGGTLEPIRPEGLLKRRFTFVSRPSSPRDDSQT